MMDIMYIGDKKDMRIKQGSDNLPCVGEFWRHYGDVEIYMRIDDTCGDVYLKARGVNIDNKMCSINVYTGIIVYTKLPSNNILTLRPVDKTIYLYREMTKIKKSADTPKQASPPSTITP